MAKSNLEAFKIVSIRRLCEISGFEYFKLYNNLKGKADTMDQNHKTQLSNSLFTALVPVFRYLGFQITLKRLDKS